MTLAGASMIAVACLYGLVSGFNDGGNLLASFTSGRVISPRWAVALLFLAPAGAVLLGGPVARTVEVNVIDLPAQGAAGFVLIVAASLAVVALSWRLGVPTSMTLALAGAMLGWALAGGRGGVRWEGTARILAGIPVSILAGGLLALGFHRAGLRLLGRLPHGRVLAIARGQYATAALQSFAYGANDLGKTVGLVAVAAVAGDGGPVSFGGPLPVGVAFACFLVGTLAGGWSVARRMGFGIVRLRPLQAMSAQFGAGAVVAALAAAGAPVSTTQTVDGGLVGVGVGVRASAVRWGVVREMLASWLLTLPAALALAALLRALLLGTGFLR
ncbi:MAG: inorganic phosphate transporter [Candidatus Dormibacterales bacterium]